MFKVEHITKDWKEAGSFQAHINLYGLWDEHCFLTKIGDLGAVLRIGGIDYESLDHAGRDYAVKRLEAAFRSLDDKCRLYQILFKHNRPAIPTPSMTVLWSAPRWNSVARSSNRKPTGCTASRCTGSS
jgi:type IV secretory pathway VirB4 component